MRERCFYLSWVDLRTDPWPQWEKLQPGCGEKELEGRRLRFDHADWPGIPCVDGDEPIAISHPKLGRLVLPGISVEKDGKKCRLYTGPTLSALFHPDSRCANFKDIDCVYLLYQPERTDSPHEKLEAIIKALCKVHKVSLFDDRLKLVPIEHLSDPTQHEAIVPAIKSWLGHDDPFRLRRKNKVPTRVIVNLSPGTPAMHAAWLMLRWNGALGGAGTVVEFVQGDGGLTKKPVSGDPLCTVPIDVLSQFIGRPVASTAGVAKTGVDLRELGRPFDDLRQRIEHAALLGLPILLHGERGTGKTFLAQYYHERRLVYRQPSAEQGKPRRRDANDGELGPGQRYPNRSSPEHALITVNLSEFADVDTLRDTLFGWAEGAFTGAIQAFDGLLGEAHGGTLFLDEIHHLERPLQAALLGPLNNHRYRPKMATQEVLSSFDLVVATNDPQWRDKLADDFRDRIERIVLEVPAFEMLRKLDPNILWKFWDFTLRQRCETCGILYDEEGTGWEECRAQLQSLFRHRPLRGNWRDLQRLADNLLLHLTYPRDGQPSPINWDKEKLEDAIGETFAWQ
jgi:hypothetical protein